METDSNILDAVQNILKKGGDKKRKKDFIEKLIAIASDDPYFQLLTGLGTGEEEKEVKKKSTEVIPIVMEVVKPEVIVQRLLPKILLYKFNLIRNNEKHPLYIGLKYLNNTIMMVYVPSLFITLFFDDSLKNVDSLSMIAAMFILEYKKYFDFMPILDGSLIVNLNKEAKEMNILEDEDVIRYVDAELIDPDYMKALQLFNNKDDDFENLMIALHKLFSKPLYYCKIRSVGMNDNDSLLYFFYDENITYEANYFIVTKKKFPFYCSLFKIHYDNINVVQYILDHRKEKNYSPIEIITSTKYILNSIIEPLRSDFPDKEIELFPLQYKKITFDDIIKGEKGNPDVTTLSNFFKGSGIVFFYFNVGSETFLVGMKNGKVESRDAKGDFFIQYHYRTKSIFYLGRASKKLNPRKENSLLYHSTIGMIIDKNGIESFILYSMDGKTADYYISYFNPLMSKVNDVGFKKSEFEFSDKLSFMSAIEKIAHDVKILSPEEHLELVSKEEERPSFKMPSTSRNVKRTFLNDEEEKNDHEEIPKIKTLKKKRVQFADDKAKSKFINCDNQIVHKYDDKKEDVEFLAKVFERLEKIHLNSLELWNPNSQKITRFYVGIYDKSTIRFLVNPDERERCYNSFEVRERLRINSYDFELTTVIMKDLFKKLGDKRIIPLRSEKLLKIIQKIASSASGFLVEGEEIRLMNSKNTSPYSATTEIRQATSALNISSPSIDFSPVNSNPPSPILSLKLEKKEEDSLGILYFKPFDLPEEKNDELDKVVYEVENSEIDEELLQERFENDIEMSDLDNHDENDLEEEQEEDVNVAQLAQQTQKALIESENYHLLTYDPKNPKIMDQLSSIIGRKPIWWFNVLRPNKRKYSVFLVLSYVNPFTFSEDKITLVASDDYQEFGYARGEDEEFYKTFNNNSFTELLKTGTLNNQIHYWKANTAEKDVLTPSYEFLTEILRNIDFLKEGDSVISYV